MCVRARYVLTHVALVQFLSCVHRIRLAENKQCFLQKAYLESGPPAKYSPSTSPPFPRFSISRVSPCGLLWNSESIAEAFEYSHVKLLACEFGACWYTHTHRLHTTFLGFYTTRPECIVGSTPNTAGAFIRQRLGSIRVPLLSGCVLAALLRQLWCPQKSLHCWGKGRAK